MIDLSRDPHPGARLHDLLRDLRRDHGDIAPVGFHGLTAHVVMGHDAVRSLFADDEGFPGGEVYRHQVERTVGRTFISMDGSEHDRYRRLVTPAFRSRAAVRFVDEQLTPLAHSLIDGFAAEGHGDLVRRFAERLPFWAISRKLGLPEGDEDRQRAWAGALLSELTDPDGARRAAEEISEVIAPVLAERRRRPGDDVISRLVVNEIDGLRLTDEEIHAHVRLLFAVGATTTADALGNALWVLATHPDVVARLSADRSLLPAFVQEVLRWEPPVPLLPRMAVHGGMIGGVELPPMSLLLVAIASANRDPSRFDDPDRFDMDRPESDVLTFGFGVKFCPGSHMARRQLLAALSALFERLPGLAADPAAPTALPSGCNLRSVDSSLWTWQPMGVAVASDGGRPLP